MNLNRWCKAVLSTGSQNQMISIVGACNISKSMHFLHKICNVDMTRAPLVHMAIFRARLPHATCMNIPVSTLHMQLDEKFPKTCITHACEVIDMDKCMLDVR